MKLNLAFSLLFIAAAPAAAVPFHARAYKASPAPFKAPPLSAFIREIDRGRGINVLKALPPGIEVGRSVIYHEPVVEERRMTGPHSYYLDPTNFELRPGYDLKRDVALIKKALASLPKQIESVWPEWRESVVDKVGLTVRENKHEEWRGPKVYVDMISRKPVAEGYYEIVRLEKKGRRWVVAEPPKEGSGILLFTSPRPEPEGAYSGVLAKHSLRDSDVVADVKWLSRSLREALKVPKRYAGHILRALSLGYWSHDSEGRGRPWVRATLTSNGPVENYQYEDVRVVKP